MARTLTPGGLEQQLEGRAAGGIDAGVIGDHPDVFAHQGGETRGGQDLNPRPDPVRARRWRQNPVISGRGRRPLTAAPAAPWARLRPRPPRSWPAGFDIAVAVGMQAGGENDHKRLGARDRSRWRCRYSRCARRNRGERGVEDSAVRRAGCPSRGRAGGAARQALRFGHGGDRLGIEKTLALTLRRHRRASGPGGPGRRPWKRRRHDRPPRPCDRRWGRTPRPSAAAPLVVGGRDAGFRTGRGHKRGVLHPQGPEDFAFAEDVQRHMRDPVHDLAQGDEIDVAVAELGPRGIDRMVPGNGRHRAVVIRPVGLGRHPGAQPEVWVMSCRMVIPPLPLAAKSGQYVAAGWSRRSGRGPPTP